MSQHYYLIALSKVEFHLCTLRKCQSLRKTVNCFDCGLRIVLLVGCGKRIWLWIRNWLWGKNRL